VESDCNKYEEEWGTTCLDLEGDESLNEEMIYAKQILHRLIFEAPRSESRL
jgi:hypothetical protein